MLIIVTFLVVFLALFLIGLLQEQKLIKTFEDNEFSEDREESVQSSNNCLETLELTLLNLDFLPSYRGQYRSILFDNKFQLERYKSFDILILNTLTSQYKIKISKSDSNIRKDLFAGTLLQIKTKGHNLLFKLPNEKQDVVYKSL